MPAPPVHQLTFRGHRRQFCFIANLDSCSEGFEDVSECSGAVTHWCYHRRGADLKYFIHVRITVYHQEELFISLIYHKGTTKKQKSNSVSWVRERTIPTERPPLVGEASANFCGYRVPRGQHDASFDQTDQKIYFSMFIGFTRNVKHFKWFNLKLCNIKLCTSVGKGVTR
jgi:hypothetical protein